MEKVRWFTTFWRSRTWYAFFARGLLLLLVVSTLGGMFLENRMIFLPSKEGMYGVDFGFPVEERAVTTRDGLELHAAYCPLANARGTILWFHGNGGNLTYGFFLVREFQKLGVSVFLVDYRGYGKSQGSPSGEGILLDAEAAYAHATEKLGIPPSKLVLLGESLGGAPAIRLASRVPCAGLVLQSTFTSIPDMAAHRMWFFPWMRFFVRTDLPNLKTIPEVRVPKLIVHSRDDEMIPFWMGRKLFDAAPEPKEFLELGGARHNDTFERPEYFDGVRGFLDRVLPK